jgi:type VI secretion system secreted protein VgrG
MQLAAQKQIFVTAGGGLDIGVLKRISLAAGEAISLFAAKLGIRIFSAKGKIQIQAQGDALELMALKDVAVSSSTGEVTITGSKGVMLGDGSGAYIKLSGGKITLGSPAGEIELKGNLTIDGAGGSEFAFPQWGNAPVKDIQQRVKPGFSS